jgi:hypothetical protein
MAKLIRESKRGTEVRCPNCKLWQLLEDYRSYTVHPHYMTELTPVIQCPNDAGERPCMHIFAPTALALKMRQDLLAGVDEQ